MSVITFEDKRWKEHPQKKEFRHKACAEFINGGTVLDIGCGDGLLLKMLREKGITAAGVDISPEAVAQCKAAGFEAQTHTLDDVLPYAHGSFDTVTMLDILEHVYDPSFALKEATRVARTTVIIGVPNFSSLPARVQVVLGNVPENNRPHKGHLYWFNWQVLNALARQAGLQPVKVKMNTFFPFSKLGAFAPRFWPNLLALSFVIKFEKELYD
jgi:methionine biosynthesis protein MetW